MSLEDLTNSRADYMSEKVKSDNLSLKIANISSSINLLALNCETRREREICLMCLDIVNKYMIYDKEHNDIQ